LGRAAGEGIPRGRPRVGTLTKVKEVGIELAEEVYPDPYGEGAAQEGSPTFFGYDSIVKVHPAED